MGFSSATRVGVKDGLVRSTQLLGIGKNTYYQQDNMMKSLTRLTDEYRGGGATTGRGEPVVGGVQKPSEVLACYLSGQKDF